MSERLTWGTLAAISVLIKASPFLAIGGAAWWIVSERNQAKEPTINETACVVRDNNPPSAQFTSITYDFNNKTVTYNRKDLVTEAAQSLTQLSPMEKTRSNEMAALLPAKCKAG